MLASRANQKYCSNNNKCKQAAANERKRQAVVKEAGVLPTQAESILAAHITRSAAQVQEALSILSTSLSAADFVVIRKKLMCVVSCATDADVLRISALDQAQAEKDYAAYLQRTGFPP